LRIFFKNTREIRRKRFKKFKKLTLTYLYMGL